MPFTCFESTNTFEGHATTHKLQPLHLSVSTTTVPLILAIVMKIFDAQRYEIINGFPTKPDNSAKKLFFFDFCESFFLSFFCANGRIVSSYVFLLWVFWICLCVGKFILCKKGVEKGV